MLLILSLLEGCQLATLDDLDEKSLVKILKEPKNSLIKQYKRLFEFENVN